MTLASTTFLLVNSSLIRSQSSDKGSSCESASLCEPNGRTNGHTCLGIELLQLHVFHSQFRSSGNIYLVNKPLSAAGISEDNAQG